MKKWSSGFNLKTIPRLPGEGDMSETVCKLIQIDEIENEIREMQREIFTLENMRCVCASCVEREKLLTWGNLI